MKNNLDFAEFLVKARNEKYLRECGIVFDLGVDSQFTSEDQHFVYTNTIVWPTSVNLFEQTELILKKTTDPIRPHWITQLYGQINNNLSRNRVMKDLQTILFYSSMAMPRGQY